MGNYMYFPDNKLEYIPAFMEFALFLLLAIFVFRFIKRTSMKETEKAKQLEQRLLATNKHETHKLK